MSHSFLDVPEELSEEQRSVIASTICNLPWEKRAETNIFEISLPGLPDLVVKYGDSDLVAEACTQHFFYTLSKEDSTAPRIPRIYQVFQSKYYFLVMEKINFPTLKSCPLADEEIVPLVATAIKWLFDQMPHVPAYIFGRIATPLSNRKPRPPWHKFFKDQEAPVAFVNTEALTKYVNKALTHPPNTAPSTPVVFSDRLTIYHADISKSNFLINTEDRIIYMIDFQHIGVFPEDFQVYSFFDRANQFMTVVGDALGYKRTPICDLLDKASYRIWISASGTFGLDEYGDLVEPKRVPRKLI